MMQKVKREDVASILAEKIMGWEDDGVGLYKEVVGGYILDPRNNLTMQCEWWNPLDDEMCCALVRDKLAETVEGDVWIETRKDEEIPIWCCMVQQGVILVGKGRLTPAGYREAICRAALLMAGMEMEE